MDNVNICPGVELHIEAYGMLFVVLCLGLCTGLYAIDPILHDAPPYDRYIPIIIQEEMRSKRNLSGRLREIIALGKGCSLDCQNKGNEVK